jgi:hypothetical protein
MNDKTELHPGFELMRQGDTFIDVIGPAWIKVDGGMAAC